MPTHQKYTELLQWHKAIEHFDYNPAVDWAIELIRAGVASENVLIVASFSKPVDREEIRPYITGALKELDLAEQYGEYSILANAHYYLEQIVSGYEIRNNLAKMYQMCLDTNMDKRLMPFYLLHHGWCDLEETGENYYFEAANLDNIEAITKEQAQIWIDQYIYGKEPEQKTEGGKTTKKAHEQPGETSKKSTWQFLKGILGIK